jgi:hypothetical protein
MILLGNLSLEEMQKRSGVEFPLELIDYMNPRKQEEAKNIKAGHWHCFDIPYTLVCGDMETATEIYKYLSPLSSKFKEQMQISLQK